MLVVYMFSSSVLMLFQKIKGRGRDVATPPPLIPADAEGDNSVIHTAVSAANSLQHWKRSYNDVEIVSVLSWFRISGRKTVLSMGTALIKLPAIV
jgi:hypothetical protein